MLTDMSGAALDSRRSWVIAVACFVVQVLTFGLTETSGLLFVGAVQRFSTTRERASQPFTLAYCVRSAIGPFIGYIGRRFGIRTVTLVGGILSSISIASCFFADSIITFTILWGVVFGISLGLETSLLCVILNEHFLKHRVKANALNVSGASIGVLLLSPVIHYLVETYGLSGTCLIISGIMLNSIPAAIVMLLNKPMQEMPKTPQHELSDSISVKRKRRTQSTISNNIMKTLPSCYDILEETAHNDRLDNTTSNAVNSETSNSKPKSSVILEVRHLNSVSNNHNRPQTEKTRVIPRFWKNRKTYTIKPVHDSNDMSGHDNDDLAHTDLNSALSYDSVFTRRMSLSNYSIKMANRNITKTNWESYSEASISRSGSYIEISDENESKWQLSRLFCDPIYIFIIIGSGIYYFSITSTYTIVVDYAQDIGVPKEYSAYILMWIAASDLCAFPFLGFIIERGYLTQSQYAALSFLGLSLASQAMVWCSSIALLLATITFFELSQCGVIILTAPLVAEYMDADLHATGIASVTILSSPITLAISPLVGFFRDKRGSYAGVFYVICASTLLCSILFFCIPRLEKRRKSPKFMRGVSNPMAFVGLH